MMRKLYSFFVMFLGVAVFGQTPTNNDIYNNITSQKLADTQLYCAPETYSLVANPAAAGSGGYDVAVAGSTLSKGSRNVSFANTVGDEHFSIVYDFPAGFNFQMYGKTYTKYVIGSSGRIILGNGTELDNLKNLSDTPPTTQIPNISYLNVGGNNLQSAQIYFGYSPRTYSQSGDYYKVLRNESSTYNGNPEIVVSISGVNLRNDNTYRKVGHAIVHLVSNTNEILSQYYETWSDDQFIAGSIHNNSVLGIQNEVGDKAKWPSTGANVNSNDINSPYRFGKWENTQNVYKFTPALKQILKYEWFEDGTTIGTTNSLSYTANGNHTLMLIITYTDGTTATSTVRFTAKTPPAQPSFITQPGTNCTGQYSLTIDNYDPALIYTWFKDNVPIAVNSFQISTVGSGIYHITASNGCQTVSSAPQTLTVNSPFPAIAFPVGTPPFWVCDNDGLPDLTTKAINLRELVNYPENNSAYSVTFTDNKGFVANAANGYMYDMASGSASITMTVQAGICRESKTFILNYQSFPASGTILTSPKLCFGETNYTVAKFKTDFSAYNGYDVEFSTDNINFNVNPVDPSANNPVYVKLSKPGFSCTSLLTLNFDFHPEVVANNPNVSVMETEHCATSGQVFDLISMFKNQVNSLSNIKVSYFHSLTDAKSNINAIPNPAAYITRVGSETIYFRAENISTQCVAKDFPSAELKIYYKPKVILGKNPIIMTHCAGDSFFDLTQNINLLVDKPELIKEYNYYSTNGTLLSPSQVAAYNSTDSTFGLKPYIRLVYNSTCYQDIHFDLKFYPPPSLTNTQISVCGETSMTKADFIRSIIGTNNFTVTYADGSPLPNNISWTTLPATISVILEDNVTHCKSGALDVEFYQPAPTTLIKDEITFELCDEDADRFDGFYTFDLNSKKSDISADTNAKFEYFDSNNAPITSPYTNKVKSAETMTVKVTSSGFCPSIAKINLKVKSPTKSSTLEDKYFLCEGSYVIDAGGENTSFAWSDGQTSQTATFSKPGNYSVTLTNSEGCSYTHPFIISDENQPKITDIIQTTDRIEVKAEGGTKPYTYYFNGVSNGNVPVLLNPTASEYKIRVVSADGCYIDEDTSVYFIKIGNVLTPNGDGINDLWKIENLDHPQMQNVEIMIADRYGKTVFHTTDKSKISWDGTYGGRPLPTASYWYVAKWYDAVTKKNEVRQSWILLQNGE